MAVVWAIVNFFIMGFNVVLFIGLVMSLVLLGLVHEPVELRRRRQLHLDHPAISLRGRIH